MPEETNPHLEPTTVGDGQKVQSSVVIYEVPLTRVQVESSGQPGPYSDDKGQRFVRGSGSGSHVPSPYS